MQYNFDFAVHRSRWSMRSVGLWPIENDLFSDFRFFLSLIVLILLLIPIVTYCFVSKNILMDLDAVMTVISIPTAIVKVTLLRIHKKNLKPIVEELSDEWNKISKLPIDSQELMISNAKRGRLLNSYLIIFFFPGLIVFLLKPILLLWKRSSFDETVPSLPFKSHYPFDFETSPAYEFIYISQFISLVVLSTAYISSDCFLAVLISHLCGQLEIVSRNIENINVQNIENCIHDTSCKCLKSIIQRHIQLIRNAEVIQEAFGIIILTQITGNVFVLCTECYMIIRASSAANVLEMLSYISYILISSFVDFIYCSIGECLIEKSTSLGHKLYEVKWYNIRPQYVRSIIIIIIRSQKPLELSAQNFFPLSLATFKNIIISAFSYTSFLLAISKKTFN